MIVIVNYGMGNLGSIANMLKKVGAQAVISSDPAVVLSAEKLILPGVGHFGNGMKQLRKLGLVDALSSAALETKVPLLGICLGAQLMTRCSEESETPGLGWINAETRKFTVPPTQPELKIPHMGWNIARPTKFSNLFQSMPDPARFYFVHSFYMKLNNADDQLTTTNHGVDFTSGFEKGNLQGVQFHPEKSHRYGMSASLKSFLP